MQPVQYRGYAQGTAFNPLILSDQSRKILEQNEQFLRGLQEKQKIERNFEVAKLKQLQENIESQRQQLNENYGYDQRQRDRYNQSLQENAARQVQDLKRIAALDQDKPTTAAVVNQVADFLVGASSTAAEVIGKVRAAKSASDQAAADFILNDGKLSNAFIGAQIGGKLVYDTATNTIISTFATAEAFKESGFVLQEGQKLIDISAGVQQLVKFNLAKNKFKTFQLDFEGQEEYEFNGEKLTRGQFFQLSAADKKAVFEQQYDSALKGLQEQTQFSPYMLQQLNTQKGNNVSKFYGQATKIQNKMLVGETIELAKLKAQSDQTPDALEEYMAVVSISKGGDRSAGRAAGVELLSDTNLFNDASITALKKATLSDQTTPGGVLISRWSDIWQDTNKNRAASNLAAERQDDIQREIEENRDIELVDEYLDKDKEDGRIDNTKHQEFEQLAKEAEGNGKYRLARKYRSQIQLTASYQKIEQARKDMDIWHAAGALFPHHVRESGVEGEEYVEYMAKANQNVALVQPLSEDLSEAIKIHESALSLRLTDGHAYKGKMPPSYYRGLRILKNTYRTAYINNYRKTGDRTAAHEAGMGASNFLIGKDKYEGLFRVPQGYEDIAKQLAAGGRIGDFEDDRLRYAPALDPTNTITDFKQRVEDLGMDAIPTVITKERMVKHFDTYRQTGRIPVDASLDVIRKELDIPYVEAFNYAVEKLGDESLKLPKELYESAKQVESVARDTPLRKFLNAHANLDKNTITELINTNVSGQPFQKSAYANAYQGNYKLEALPKAALPYLPVITKYANQYSIPMPIALGLAMHESKFDPKALSKSDAVGEFQLIPKTAEYLGVDPLNSEQNIEGGLRYLREILDGKHAFGRKPRNMKEALEMYNAGPNYEDGIYPRNNVENRNYARRVDEDRQPGVLDFADQFRLRGN